MPAALSAFLLALLGFWTAVAALPANAQQPPQVLPADAPPEAAPGNADATPTDEPAAAPPPVVLFQPRGVQAGPLTVTPRLGVTTGRNDNVNLAPPVRSSPFRQAPVSSGFTTWTPELSVLMPGGEIDRYEFNLRGELTHYFSSSNNDSANAELDVDGLNLLDPRTALAWRASAQDCHDPVGATDLSLQASSPDHFHAEAAGAVLRHDSESGAVRVEAEAAASHKRYVNHREVTRLGNVDTASWVARAFYVRSAGPTVTTRWVAEARQSVAHYPSYPDELLSLDNTDTRASVGLQWEPSDAADPVYSGTFKLGVQRRQFDAERARYSGATLDVVQRWQPRAGTQFDFSAGRAAADAPGDDSDEVVVLQEALSWTQLWRADLRSTLTAVNGANRYRFGAAVPGPARHDRVGSLELAVRFDLRRDVQVGLNLGVARRTSNNAFFEYKRHLNAIVLQVAL